MKFLPYSIWQGEKQGFECEQSSTRAWSPTCRYTLIMDSSFSINWAHPNIQSIFLIECSNSWSTNPTNNFFKKTLKQKELKMELLPSDFISTKTCVVQGWEKSNSCSYGLYKLGCTTELEWSHLCEAPSTTPRCFQWSLVPLCNDWPKGFNKTHWLNVPTCVPCLRAFLQQQLV